MSKKKRTRYQREDRQERKGPDGLDRRQFLGEGLALGTGGLLASLGLSEYADAQNAHHARGSGREFRRFVPPPPLKHSQPPPLKDLRGKVAYISAASGGIGLGIARAAVNAGMKVCIGYRQKARLEAALALFPSGAEVLPIWHDVRSRPGWVHMLDQAVRRFGNLHLVVNNAGIKTLVEASKAPYALWDNTVAVNFTAIFNSVHVCLPHMLKHGEGGQFVTTASMDGLLPGVNAGVYNSTKIAAVGIMEALRVELERTTVGTSAFCPGAVITDNYYGSGKVNPFLAKHMPAFMRGRKFKPIGMLPLEAGERVLNGVVHNDLFILSHPEFKPGTAQRFEAILDSFPPITQPIAPARMAFERGVLTCPIYPLEIAHRKVKRKSYLTV